VGGRGVLWAFRDMAWAAEGEDYTRQKAAERVSYRVKDFLPHGKLGDWV